MQILKARLLMRRWAFGEKDVENQLGLLICDLIEV